jgi:hypothetical protein
MGFHGSAEILSAGILLDRVANSGVAHKDNLERSGILLILL